MIAKTESLWGLLAGDSLQQEKSQEREGAREETEVMAWKNDRHNVNNSSLNR